MRFAPNGPASSNVIIWDLDRLASSLYLWNHQASPLLASASFTSGSVDGHAGEHPAIFVRFPVVRAYRLAGAWMRSPSPCFGRCSTAIRTLRGELKCVTAGTVRFRQQHLI